MGKELILFKSEESKDLQSVAAFLRQLADKLVEHKVILRQGEQVVEIELPETVVLEIKVEEEAKKKRTQRSLEVEIEWYVGEQNGSGSVTLG